MFLSTPLPLTSPPPLPVTDGAVSMFVNLAYERWGFLRRLWPLSGWEPVPSVTGGACFFENGCLTSSLHGRVHFVNVTNVVFRSIPCSQRLFCARTGLVIR